MIKKKETNRVNKLINNKQINNMRMKISLKLQMEKWLKNYKKYNRIKIKKI